MDPEARRRLKEGPLMKQLPTLKTALIKNALDCSVICERLKQHKGNTLTDDAVLQL